MQDRTQAAETLSAMGIRLQRGEKVRSLLALGTGGKDGQSPKEGCFVLTDQRILHRAGGAAEPRVQSASLRDVAAARVEKQSRYMGFLLAAGFVFMIGIPFEIALAVSGAFSGAALGAVLFLGGSSWLAGGIPVETRWSV